MWAVPCPWCSALRRSACCRAPAAGTQPQAAQTFPDTGTVGSLCAGRWAGLGPSWPLGAPSLLCVAPAPTFTESGLWAWPAMAWGPWGHCPGQQACSRRGPGVWLGLPSTPQRAGGPWTGCRDDGPQEVQTAPSPTRTASAPEHACAHTLEALWVFRAQQASSPGVCTSLAQWL